MVMLYLFDLKRELVLVLCVLEFVIMDLKSNKCFVRVELSMVMEMRVIVIYSFFFRGEFFFMLLLFYVVIGFCDLGFFILGSYCFW